MPHLTKHLPFYPAEEQKHALEQLFRFLHDSTQVFVLKGYAGTGKTTLMKSIIHYLASQEIPYALMASTGRAAKVLADKTGEPASTIHSKIYILEKIEDKNQEIKKNYIRA